MGEFPTWFMLLMRLPILGRNTLADVLARLDCSEEGHQLIRTKGDNNDVDDVSLYPPGQKFVYRRQIIGLVRGYLPFVGLFTIHVGKVPWLREIILMGLLASIMLGKGKARPAGIRAHRSEH
jgi:signal peptidase